MVYFDLIQSLTVFSTYEHQSFIEFCPNSFSKYLTEVLMSRYMLQPWRDRLKELAGFQKNAAKMIATLYKYINTHTHTLYENKLMN